MVTATDRDIASDKGRASRVSRFLIDKHPSIVAGLIVIVAWQLSTYIFPPIVAPPLSEIGGSIWAILTDPSELQHLLRTGARLIVALVIGFIIGTVLGAILGLRPRLREYIKPILYMVQGVPALAWVVFAVIWFEDVEVRILFILVIVTMPNFALYTEGAVRAVSQELMGLARAYRANQLQTLRIVVLPSIIPSVLSSWVVNLGNGVRAVVVAELIGSTLGVGYQLLQAQSVYNMAAAIAWTVLLVLMLMLLQGIVGLVERRLLSWRPE